VTCSCCEQNDSDDCARTSSARREELSRVIITAQNGFYNFRYIGHSFSDGRVEVSDELKDLYTVYQQEIHASVYTSLPRTQSRMVYDTKLPPIYSRT
jgi:hypothetical protein